MFFLVFFAEFELLMFPNNTVQNSEKNAQAELVEILPQGYLPYGFLHNLHSFLLKDKVKIFIHFQKPITHHENTPI